MKKILLIIAFLFLLPFSVSANEKVGIYVFHNYNCPHCKEALEYFNDLIKKDDTIILYDYELLHEENAYNRVLYNDICSLLDINIQSVPLIIIGNEYYIGFSKAKIEPISKTIDFYKKMNIKILLE